MAKKDKGAGVKSGLSHKAPLGQKQTRGETEKGQRPKGSKESAGGGHSFKY
jgi:hypothetical protein